MTTAKFAVRDLLVDPNAPRWVVADKGSTWVTDRYVMVRGDLFRQLPKSRPTSVRPTLPVSAARTLLAMARGVGKPLASTTVRLVQDGRGDHARAWRAGAVVIFLNERVTRTFYLANLRPRYIGAEQVVAWYGMKRGRDVLMAIQKPVMPFGLEFNELEECVR